jgi:hypothetical protein
VGADLTPLPRRDESIRDPLRRSLSTLTGVRCTGAWTPPEPWTHRTRPRLLGKPHRTRFPTAPTRIIPSGGTENRTKDVNPPYTRNRGHSRGAANEDEEPRFRELLAAADLIIEDTKIAKLLQTVRDRFADRSVLFFTEYKATQGALLSALAATFGERTVTFINGDDRLDDISNAQR